MAEPEGFRPTVAPGPDDPALPQWIERELSRAATSISERPFVQFVSRGTAPEKPREGMVAYGDGSGWNPGYGEGLYVWDGVRWNAILVSYNSLAAREKLTADRTYSVPGDFSTPQEAWDHIADNIDGSGFVATIQLADGTHAGINSDKGVLGFGYLGVKVRGNASDRTAVKISTTGVSSIQFFETGGPVSLGIYDVTFESITSGDHVFAASDLVYVGLFNVKFGACAGVNLRAYNNAEIDILSNFEIAASPSSGIFATVNAGAIIAYQGLTVTLTGTPNFANGFAYANGGQILIQQNTYSGAATGVRFQAVNQGMIDLGAGGTLTTLPGNVDGACDPTSTIIGAPGFDYGVAWRSYTATSSMSGGGGTFTTTAAYKAFDKKVSVRAKVVCTAGVPVGGLDVTLPLNVLGGTLGVGTLINTTANKSGTANAGYAAAGSMRCFFSDGTVPIANGDTVWISVEYEAA